MLPRASGTIVVTDQFPGGIAFDRTHRLLIQTLPVDRNSRPEQVGSAAVEVLKGRKFHY